MKALLNIQGWTKVINISLETLHYGYVKVPLYPPLTSLLCSPSNKPIKEDIETQTVILRYEDEKTPEGWPIFTYHK